MGYRTAFLDNLAVFQRRMETYSGEHMDVKKSGPVPHARIAAARDGPAAKSLFQVPLQAITVVNVTIAIV